MSGSSVCVEELNFIDERDHGRLLLVTQGVELVLEIFVVGIVTKEHVSHLILSGVEVVKKAFLLVICAGLEVLSDLRPVLVDHIQELRCTFGSTLALCITLYSEFLNHLYRLL